MGQRLHGIERAGVIGPASLRRSTCAIDTGDGKMQPILSHNQLFQGLGDTHKMRIR